jgi:hypothetical protein
MDAELVAQYIRGVGELGRNLGSLHEGKIGRLGCSL